jgi:hypothetical protein
MKKNFVLLAFSLLLLFTGKISAQHPDAEALLQKTQIRIGEQVELKLAIRYNEGTKKSVVTWPVLQDTLVRGLEIVKLDTLHTILANRASVLYEQSRTVVITAFDSGMYVIPPQRFIVNKDTAETLPLTLFVVSVPVDTNKPIKDIKEIYDVPPAPPAVKKSEPLAWYWYVIGGVVILALLLLFYFITRKKQNLPVLPSFSRQLLPHEKVLEQLAELGRKKPWLHGELKSYHISLTTILRAWTVERYKIHAREMTTGEIINALYSQRVNATAVMQLERVLRTADMVKFAKGIPPDDENENVLQLAIKFVEATAVYPETVNPSQQ